jgi:iron uptake system EfeUOB component EfeO/EfeM
VLEKIDSKFTEVDHTLEKFKDKQSTFGDGMAEKIDTMMMTVQNVSNQY